MEMHLAPGLLHAQVLSVRVCGLMDACTEAAQGEVAARARGAETEGSSGGPLRAHA